jgi:hypothetical protein
MIAARLHLACLWMALLAGPAAAAEPAQWILDSRAAAAALGSRLTAELQAGLARSPVEAIAICRERAPQIAAEEAARSGARVGRTALRVRNPANAATAWQREVLEEFTAALARGEDPAGLEFTAEVETGNGVERRWMKPILLAPLCTTCHGHTLAPGVGEAVARAYPEDRATGFAPGELRGAFVVVSRPPRG